MKCVCVDVDLYKLVLIKQAYKGRNWHYTVLLKEDFDSCKLNVCMSEGGMQNVCMSEEWRMQVEKLD